MDIRIGVTQSPRELSFELPDDTNAALLYEQVDKALTGELTVLWLSDKKGKRLGVPTAKIAYVEVGAPDGERRIGFGS